jgi:glycosyltransferase involved in cell wall biosynthesis
VPRVSIVLTTYNRAEALKQTLDTLVTQTLRDFELIICDDASTDNTEDVARRYTAGDRRIVYRRNTRNLRMPGNLNEGIRNAQGTYIANLHDGDIYAPRLLEKWAEALDRFPTAAFVFNQYRALDDKGAEERIYREDLGEIVPGRELLERWYFRRWRFDSPVWGTVMARRDAYISAGLFDPRFSFISDVDMWMRLAEEHDAAYIAEPLISLPSRSALPRKWNIREDRLLRTMYWEARMRHFRKRPARKGMEAIRHVCFALAGQAFRTAAASKAIMSKLVNG